jgi:hypothetical protein
MKIIISFLCVLLAGFAHAVENQAGFVLIKSDGAGYIYFPESQSLPPLIFIQRPDTNGRPKCCLNLNRNELEKIKVQDYEEIPGTAGAGFKFIKTAEEPYPISPNGFVIYKITSKLPNIENDFVGAAIAAEKIVKSSPYRLLASTNGKRSVTWLCFGEEGQNLISREDNVYQSLYISLGPIQNVQPQCTARDLVGIQKSVNPRSRH